MTSPNAAILFEPEGYVLDGPRLMGRQAAGNAFLRAAVAGLKEQTLSAYTPSKRSAQVFAQLVKALDPEAQTAWIPAHRMDLLAQIGTLYLPGPGLSEAARLRLRTGSGAYSVVGLTHTIASHTAADAITGLLAGPVMPWDALVCTSRAAQHTVQALLREAADYLRWRMGAQQFVLPQFPLIPLGVHGSDFEFTGAERAAARQALGIAADEVVALFFGRLSFHAKAHPHAMYLGLEEAARKTGKKVALLQCGRFANEHIEHAFKDGAAQFAPNINAMWADGRDADASRRVWAAADIFISLSDNIQETFGLTPIEAMAAGLPVVVTDWDGYRDTVRDGVDGFRIPCWMPPAPLGENYALRYQAGSDNYDMYCGLACQHVATDLPLLAERLADLVSNPALRRQLGEQGRQRARSTYDWATVFGQYQSLWTELAAMRAKAAAEPANAAVLARRRVAARMDPFRTFAAYPSHTLGPETRVARAAASVDWATLRAHPLFSYAGLALPTAEVAQALINALPTEGNTPLQRLAEAAGMSVEAAILAVSSLAKAGLVRLTL